MHKLKLKLPALERCWSFARVFHWGRGSYPRRPRVVGIIVSRMNASREQSVTRMRIRRRKIPRHPDNFLSARPFWWPSTGRLLRSYITRYRRSRKGKRNQSAREMQQQVARSQRERDNDTTDHHRGIAYSTDGLRLLLLASERASGRRERKLTLRSPPPTRHLLRRGLARPLSYLTALPVSPSFPSVLARSNTCLPRASVA